MKALLGKNAVSTLDKVMKDVEKAFCDSDLGMKIKLEVKEQSVLLRLFKNIKQNSPK